ncbi:MAG: NADH-quinone oxidoreductase subunit H [Pseudomonadota bacterium]|nr:NADH-quinone oxidoreductase subunit H [Pseudomonadota bacterium]
MSEPAAIVGALALLLAGAYFVAVLDHVTFAVLARRRIGNPFLRPLRSAAALLVQQQSCTEHPDALNWKLAPALYLGLAAMGIAVVPMAVGATAVDMGVGIVVWGSVEALVVIVVFLHGWSANSALPLIGAYRYVAIALPIMLLSMFVLIATAIPAQSLSLPAIVESQRSLWNALRQPLGLPLFLLLGLSLTLRGPFDYADSADLSGGTSAEISGAARLVWQSARLAMLVSFAALASTAFLGGYLGPVLPGPLWLAIKTAVLLVVLVAAGHLFARLPPSRMLTLLWTVLLPLAFIDLLWAGVAALR